MKELIVKIFQKLLVRPTFVPVYIHLYKLSLRGMGVLNSGSLNETGEQYLLQKVNSSNVPIEAVCDVGANTGGYTLTMLEYFPNAEYHAFEPNPEIFKKLKNYLKDNEQINLYNLAVSNKKEKIKLYDFAEDAPLKPTQPTSTLASIHQKVITELHKQPSKAYEVKAITLDSWTKENKIDRIDWLKIDTEGHELAILKGAKELIDEQKIGLVQFEFNEMNAYSHTFLKEILDILQGYHLFRLLPNGWWPLDDYRPVTYEIFGFQNIVALNQKTHERLEK